MLNIFNYLEKIEKVQGLIAKEDLLKELIINDSNAEKFLKIVFNDDLYGINDKIIEKVLNYDALFHGHYKDVGQLAYTLVKGNRNITFNDFINLINNIKQLSGNKLITFLKYNINIMKPLDAKWFVRCLIKNLHNGVGLKIVNKVFKKLNLPIIEKFSVQLCGKIDNIENWNIFPVMVGVKYDGFRCIAKKINNNISLTSRQGKDVSGFLPEIVDMLKNIKDDFIFDGEILADNFNSISKRIGRKIENLEPVPGLHYRVFDLLYYNGMNLKNISQYDRSFILNINFTENNLLKFEEIYQISNKKILIDLYNKIVSRGEEGIVIKLIEKPYIYDSRDNWFKVKPVFEATFEITGFEFGKGKFKDTIGALLYKDKTGFITGKVGSGLNDINRKILLNLANNNKLIGSFIDIKYNEISKNKDNLHSLRFPRFIKIRFDKNEADDLSSV